MPTTVNIKEPATEARNVLDAAKRNFKKVREVNTGERIAKALDLQSEQLAETRELLTKLIIQSTLQLKLLEEPLHELKKYLDALANLLADPKPASVDTDELTYKVGDVVEATKDLRNRIPGNSFSAIDDVVDDYGILLAGPVEAKMDLSNAPLHVESRGNRAGTGAVAVLAGFGGPATILEKMQANAYKRAAQAAQEEAQKEVKGQVKVTKSG